MSSYDSLGTRLFALGSETTLSLIVGGAGVVYEKWAGLTGAMSMEGDRIVGTPGHSPALRYELQLIECGRRTDQPSQARAALCFEVLDQLLPQLGVWQRVLCLLRDELYSAVYSREYTAATRVRKASPAKSAKPEKLPFFTIARRHMEKRNQDVAKLQTEIDSLKEQLYTCEAELEKASSAVEAHRHDLRDRDARIHKLSAELRSRSSEGDRLSKMAAQHQRLQDRLRAEAEYRVLALGNTISSLGAEKSELQRYKNTHDGIQLSLARIKPLVSASASDPSASREAMLEQQLETARLLHSQLLAAQNMLVDEYDSLVTASIPSMADASATATHKMIRQQQAHFRANVAAISGELSLLQDHTSSLEAQLHTIHSSHAHTDPHSHLTLPNHPSNPLVPQEQVFSKFAAMLYTSSDGSTYFPLKEAQDCLSCGEKTVICPHHISSRELVVQLSLATSHLKITRPQLRLTGKMTPGAAGASRSGKIINEGVVEEEGRNEGVGEGKGRRERDEAKMAKPDFDKIWHHFRQTFNTERSLPRQLSMEQLVAIVHPFLAAVLHEDDVTTASISSEEDQIPSLLECLYTFMSRRYLVPDIVAIATHDFLSALSQHNPDHKELRVVSCCLSSSLDGAAWRYLLLLASLVAAIPWTSTKEFTPWAAITYPQLQEEDLEQLTLNFTASTGGGAGHLVSPALVMDYLASLLLRHREPRVAQMESLLADQPSRHPGCMKEVEFAEAMDNLLPLVPDQLCRRLFLQSLAAAPAPSLAAAPAPAPSLAAATAPNLAAAPAPSLAAATAPNHDRLPLRSLAYIAAYLSLLQGMAAMRDALSLLSSQLGPPQTSSQTSSAAPLPTTMEHVRRMISQMH